jgi:non-canonical purine NTP pyrophosphatase (RdgB/HAM1 family)
MDIVLITGNRDKHREAEAILNRMIGLVELELEEIQELDPKKIAEHKAQQAWDAIHKPLFVWDQSIYIHCLHGFPGPLIKWFWPKVTLERICEIAEHFQDPAIEAETILTYHDGKQTHHFYGKIDGTIPPTPRGEKGWGWDPIFIPRGQTRTCSEMDRKQVVNFRSHRIALEKLRDFFDTKT